MATERITDCLEKLINSTQINKRKEYLKKLRELIDDENNQLLLDQAGSGKNACQYFGWQKIFECCHLSLQEYINSYSNKTTVKSNLQDDALKLVAQVANLANRDGNVPYLVYLPSANMCMSAAKKEPRYCQEFYIELLHDKLVSLPGYWTDLNTEQWNDLVDFAMEMYDQMPSTIKFKLINILDICIHVGSRQSLVVLNLKNKFQFFEKILDSVGDSASKQHFAEIVLKMNISLAMELALECRFALCKLGEIILPILLNLTKRDTTHLIKYCILQMALHHPNGAEKGSDAAYAADWENWCRILSHIFMTVQTELRYCFDSAKVKSRRNQEPTVPDDLVELGVEIFKQIFSMDSDEITTTQANNSLSLTCNGPSSKRARLEIGFQVLIDQLKSAKKSEEICVRLIVLSGYLKKYGYTLKHEEYKNVLQMLAETRSLSRTSLVMKHLCQCCNSLLGVFPITQNLAEKEAVQVLWSKIWDMALRSAGLNQCVESSNGLLQALLLSELNGAFNKESLLELYYKNIIHLNTDSLKTLTTLAKTNHLSSLDKSLATSNFSQEATEVANWQLVLNWLLPGKEEEEDANSKSAIKTSANLLGEALVRFTCKNKISLENYGSPAYETEIGIKRVQKIHVTHGGDKCKDNLPKASTSPLIVKPQFFSSGLDFIVALFTNNTLENFCDTQQTQCVGETNLDNFNFSVHRAMVYSTILSHILQLGLLQQDDFESFSLAVDLKQLLNVVIPANLQKLVTTVKGPFPIQDVLQLNIFYSARYHKLVLTSIRKWTCAIFLKTIMKFATTGSSRVAKSQDFSGYASFVDAPSFLCPFPIRGELTREEEKVLSFTKIISSFCFHPDMPINSAVLELSKEILRSSYNLLDHANNPANMQQIIITLKIASLASRHFDIDHLNITMEILKDLTRKHNKNMQIVVPILNICQDTLEFLHASNNKTHKLTAQTIVKGFKTIIIDRKEFGAQVRLALFSCIINWMKVDPEQVWATVKDVPVALVALEFLKDPFQEVKIAVSDYLQQIFVPEVHSWTTEKILAWRRTALDKLLLTVNESAPQKDAHTKDDTLNFGTSAMKNLYAAMLYCPVWRRKTVSTILELQSIHKIDVKMILETFTQLGSDLGCNFSTYLESNLRSLLEYWCKKRAISEFPYKLLMFESRNDFYKKCYPQIVTALMLLENRDSLNSVASDLQKSTIELVAECKVDLLTFSFPVIAGITELERKTFTKLEKFWSILKKFLTDGEEDMILSDNFMKVIFNLYAALYDEPLWQNKLPCKLVLTAPDQYSISHNDLQGIFHWIQRNLPEEMQVIKYLANDHAGFCQTLLLKMATRISTATTREDKLLFFLQYYTLVRDISQILGKNQLGHISQFVVRDVVHVHLNMLRISTCAEHGILSTAIGVSLESFLGECSKNLAEVLEPLVPVIVNSLVILIKDNLLTPFADAALAVVKFLVVTNSNIFVEAIHKLEQFPRNVEFADIQATYDRVRSTRDDHLESEIERFLAAGEASSGNRVEGLIRLRQQLATRKQQLQLLYAELKSLQEFSRPRSCLHQLISSLVNMSKSSDEQVALEAASCLGELGPGELMTTVLIDLEEIGTRLDSENIIVHLYGKMIELFYKYLIDPNNKVCELASEALHHLLRTKEGKTALEKFPKAEDLFPFQCGTLSREKTVKVSDVKFLSTMHDADIWCPKSETTHSTWITHLTSLIFQTISYSPIFLQTLVDFCNFKEEFAESILPHLLYFICISGGEECSRMLVQQLDHFFEEHFKARHTAERKRTLYVSSNKRSLESMLSVVHFLRVNSVEEIMTNLNFLYVAQAAQYCSAHFSCIYYAELYGLSKKISSSGKLQSIDHVCDNSEEGKALHENLISSYKSIADPDAMYGCGMGQLLDNKFQQRYFEHCKEWDKVLLLQDLDACNMSATTMLQRMAPTMMNLGLQNLLHTNLNFGDDSKLRDAQLQCCWRLGKWDEPNLLEVGNIQSASYESSRYSALKCLYTKDYRGLEVCLDLGKKAVIDSLKLSNLESIENIYTALSKLQMLQEIKDVLELLPDEFLEKWQEQNSKSDCRFEYLEPILSQRLCLVNILQQTMDTDSQSSERLNSPMANAELLLTVSKIARLEHSFHVSERALTRLSNVQNISRENYSKALLEKAKCYWDQRNFVFGKQILSNLLDELRKMCADKNRPDLQALQFVRGKVLRTLGTWHVETGSENARVIIEDYLMPAVKIFEENADFCEKAEKVDTIRTLAKFADTEYQRIVKCMNSPNYKAKVAQMMETAGSVAAIDSKVQRGADLDLRKAYTVNLKQNNIDKGEIETINKEKGDYLKLALEFYIKCLSMSDERVSTVFRVISLLLENKEISGQFSLQQVPSYKFVPVIPQLTPHLNTVKDDFQKVINTLLMRLAVEHPHHTLPHIFALKFAALDTEFDDEVKPPANESRQTEATKMIEKLKTTQQKHIIKQLENVTLAVVELAYYSKENLRHLGENKIPDNLNVRKIKNYDKIQVATSSLTVQKSGCYQPNGILRYEPKFSLVGGIHAPKKIICTSMDGTQHVQLCKGLDDLHLDAVMQQVFTIMNRMFLRSTCSSNRKLSVRTYNVCPLSQRSGLIEWCTNTIPIGAYLLKAHPRNNPGDADPKACRSMMNQCENSSTINNKAKRIKTFQDICKTFRPAFHNFFLEHFLLPAEWFVRRLAYTRSVATSSMIGYILGIGDRHVQNILIDTKTAEVIHIDFGICFEQGLVLSIPESVPFRLSRDIEAGFGISGTEGVFKRSSEAALQVLRDNQTTIQSILQVLLYNPMYVWTIPLSQNQNNRKGIKGTIDTRPSNEANQLAERALQRLQEKLMGTEEGMANSVEGQVNRLIQKARDPQNLALMFSGWQPYL